MTKSTGRLKFIVIGENVQIEKYAIVRNLEEGNYANIYKAKDSKNNLLALKIARRKNFNDIIAREFEILSQFRHPNIIEAYDYGQVDDGRAFFTLEYLFGQPINSYFKGYSLKCISAILQVIHALSAIHKKGFVHCDLKPEHIFYLPKKEKVVLIDFGFAGEISNKIERGGTVGYIAPEVLKGTGFDARADLYSLGLIIYEILVGAKLRDAFQPIKEITEDLNNILACLLSQEPARRPSITELHTAFCEYLPSGELKKPSFRVTPPKTSFVKIPEIYDALSNANSKAIILFGDIGSGKTTLLKELKFEFLMKGYNVLYHVPEQGISFLEQLLSFTGCKTSALFDYEGKLQIYGHILNRLVLLANNKKIVILIDDCDGLSDYELALFRYIGHGVSSSDILLIGSSKSDERVKNLDFENLTLRPFDLDETLYLLEKTFSRIELPVQFSKWLQEQSGGNPLFIVEILKTLFNNNFLYYRSGKWRIDKRLSDKIEIPQKIEELLRNRINKMDGKEQEILKTISLCDTPLNAQLLNSVSQSEIHVSIEHLKACALIKEKIIDSMLVYVLPNGIIKQIIDCLLTKDERRSLQDRLLDAIRKAYPDDGRFLLSLAELHYALGKKKKAAVYYMKAAQDAEKIHDYESALRCYEKIAKSIQDKESEKCAEVLMKIANIHQITGNNKLAISYYNKVLTSKIPKVSKNAHLELGRTYSAIGEHKKAAKYFKKVISLVKTKNTKLYIKAINSLGYSMLYLNAFEDAEALFKESLTISRKTKDLEMKGESLYYQAVFEWFSHDYDTGIEKAKKTLEFSKKNKLLKQSTYTANLLSSLYQSKNDSYLASKYLDDAITGFRNMKHINALCGALNNQAMLQHEIGNLPKSIELFSDALRQARKIGKKTTEYIALLNLGIISTEMGRFDEAITYFEKVSKMSPNTAESVYGIVMTLYKKGDIDKAKLLLEQEMKTKKEVLYYFGSALLECVSGEYINAEKSINEGLGRIESESPDRETKIEALLNSLQFYFEKGDFKKSLDYASKLANVTNPLSREYNIASALIKISKYNLLKKNEIRIKKELVGLEKMGCIYDYAWIKRLRVESMLNREPKSAQIRPIAQELNELEQIFESLGAGLELSRARKIQNRLFPIIVEDYSRKAISKKYLDPFSHLATLINQHLGDEDFVQRALDLIIHATGAERGALFMRSASGRMKFAVGRNIDRNTLKDAAELSKSTIESLKKEQIVFSADALRDPHFSSKKSVKREHIRSLMCIPLMVSKNVIGAVYLDSRILTEVFGPQDKDFLITVSQILASVIEKSMVFKQAIDENILLKSKILHEIGKGYIIGKSKRMTKIYKQIEDIAHTDAPVLITGETGTGKGMIARLIHLQSKRKDNEFLSINCSTIAETLFESELFGHKRGSFTGAFKDKKGLLEEAENGTVFLDEIANTSIALQAELLEAIEEKVIRRIGETCTRRINVRFLFATNRDLEIEVENCRFRKDLFYRIDVFRLNVPPLRERGADITLLAQFFLERNCKEINKRIDGFSPEALTQLRKHSWPGNIRELQNVIERAVIGTQNRIITTEDIDLDEEKAVIIPLIELKKGAIIEALNASNWRVQKAAEMLKINRRTIHRYLKKYRIQVK